MKEKIIIKAKIKDEDGSIKEIEKQVEIDLINEGNQFFTKEEGELVILEKDGKKYPVVVNVSFEKSMTSASYLPGNREGNRIQSQKGSKWEIASQKIEFPNNQSRNNLFIWLLIGVLVTIIGIVSFFVWKKRDKKLMK